MRLHENAQMSCQKVITIFVDLNERLSHMIDGVHLPRAVNIILLRDSSFFA